jgi:spore germination cell wall hydrolase CwlJ-like protein
MTALASGLHWGWAMSRRAKRTVAAFLSIAALAACAATLFPLSQPALSATVTVQIPPAKAAALVQATSGAAATQMEAVGDQAKVINAALPFSTDALHTARPFDLKGSDVDARRALLCLTQAVYYEAGFEPVAGRRAVAQVVLNRLRHPAFPKSVCGVVYQGAGSGVCQFTFVCDGALYRKPAHEPWLEAEAVARAALEGYVDGTVGEATHYHADYVAPRWAPLLDKVVQIGQHIFYRWPGAWGEPAAFTGRYIGEPLDPAALRPLAPVAAAPQLADGAAIQVAEAGPVEARAPNDVGGLLDASKGWTLNIPGPDQSESAAARILAAQQSKPLATREIASATGAPVAGSR